MKIKNIAIPRPDEKAVERSLERWSKDFPTSDATPDLSLNIDANVVIEKIRRVNKNEHTRLSAMEIEGLAKYIAICIPEFDERLRNDDLTLVSQLATEHNTRQNADRERPHRLYSFSSKYCNLHNPSAFPKYDKLVCEVLRHFQYEYGFMKKSGSSECDLDDYNIYIMVLDQFSKHFGLTDFTRSEIDHYLWYLGKDCCA